MDEPLYTSDAAHLRAQLAALAEEHETLAAHTRIVEANLKALVEKVSAHVATDDALAATNFSDEAIEAAGKAWAELKDLARSLDV